MNRSEGSRAHVVPFVAGHATHLPPARRLMHIVDGALTAEVVVAGTAAAGAGLALGLRELDLERIPTVGLLAAAVFVASLIHVPLGPSSVHLLLSGLAGLVLGWAVFPAIAVAMVLDAAFLGFGGITTLGVNTAVIAVPGAAVGLLLRGPVRRAAPQRAALLGGVAGAGAILGTAGLAAAALVASDAAFRPAAVLVILTHLPIALLEGLVTAAAVGLVRRVKPELFGPAPTSAAAVEAA